MHLLAQRIGEETMNIDQEFNEIARESAMNFLVILLKNPNLSHPFSLEYISPSVQVEDEEKCLFVENR